MLGQPKHATSPVPGSEQETFLAFPSLSSSEHPGSLSEGHLFQALSIHVAPGLFQLGSHCAFFKGPCLHSLFLCLKGRNCGEKTVPTFFLHPFEMEVEMALPGWLTSFGFKSLILTRFEAAG